MRTHWAVKNVDLMQVLQPILEAHEAQHTSLVTPPGRVETRPRPQAFGAEPSVDAAILTVIPAELAAVLDALNISDAEKEKTAHGTVYFRGTLRSHPAGRDYSLAVTCIGATWPPWLLRRMILRTPARATLAPISAHTRTSVSKVSVSVPG